MEKGGGSNIRLRTASEIPCEGFVLRWHALVLSMRSQNGEMGLLTALAGLNSCWVARAMLFAILYFRGLACGARPGGGGGSTAGDKWGRG